MQAQSAYLVWCFAHCMPSAESCPRDLLVGRLVPSGCCLCLHRLQAGQSATRTSPSRATPPLASRLLICCSRAVRVASDRPQAGPVSVLPHIPLWSRHKSRCQWPQTPSCLAAIFAVVSSFGSLPQPCLFGVGAFKSLYNESM